MAYEQPCIAALWTRPEAVDAAQSLKLTPDAFADEHYRLAAQAIYECHADGLTDEVEYHLKVVDKWPDKQQMVLAAVHDATTTVASTVNHKVWLRNLATAWAERRKHLAVEEAYTKIKEGAPISEAIHQLTEAIYSVDDSVKLDEEKNKEWQRQVAAEIADRIRGGTDNLTPTYIPQWDKVFGAFRNHEFVVIGARPAVGKSSLARELMMQQVKHARRPVLFISLEMGISEVVQCVASMATGISSFGVETDFPTNQQKLIEAAEKITQNLGKLFLIRDDLFNLRDIEDCVRRTVRSSKPSLIVVDYLQLIEAQQGRGSNRTQEVSVISRRLKQLAQQCKTPVVALCQLSRDLDRDDRKPRLSDLRESGSIEQDADRVVFIHPMKDEQDKVELIQAKMRGGPCRTLEVAFNRHSTRFVFDGSTVPSSAPQTSLQTALRYVKRASAQQEPHPF
jgi:replicative DNA helicase